MLEMETDPMAANRATNTKTMRHFYARVPRTVITGEFELTLVHFLLSVFRALFSPLVTRHTLHLPPLNPFQGSRMFFRALLYKPSKDLS